MYCARVYTCAWLHDICLYYTCNVHVQCMYTVYIYIVHVHFTCTDTICDVRFYSVPVIMCVLCMYGTAYIHVHVRTRHIIHCICST